MVFYCSLFQVSSRMWKIRKIVCAGDGGKNQLRSKPWVLYIVTIKSNLSSHIFPLHALWRIRINITTESSHVMMNKEHLHKHIKEYNIDTYTYTSLDYLSQAATPPLSPFEAATSLEEGHCFIPSAYQTLLILFFFLSLSLSFFFAHLLHP